MHLPWKDGKLDPAGLAWRSTRYSGIEWFPLFEAEGEGPRETLALIRMAPGCGYPAHEHLGVEDVLILAGGYTDERGVHRAGDWVRYEAGSAHSPVATAGEPCLLWAHARSGVRNLESRPKTANEG